jgi:hypothetical protein
MRTPPTFVVSTCAAALLACLPPLAEGADKWVSVDKTTGQGVFVWDTGARYTGPAVKGKREGRGTIVYPDGRVIEGIFVNNALVSGHMTFPDGIKYDGDFVNGKFDGRGRRTDSKGITFEGTFKNGEEVFGTITFLSGRKVEVDLRAVAERRTGPAVLLDTDESRTTGQLVNGVLQGPGSRTFRDGATFEGTFKDGDMAEGTYRYANGDVYTGGLKDGLRDGNGVMSTPNGDRYEGMWRRGGMFGEGVAAFASGARWTGTFDNSKLVKGSHVDAKGAVTEVESMPRLNRLTGQGMETTVTGDRYEGGFVNGLRDGQGTIVRTDGTRIEGNFSKDVLISGTRVRPEGFRYEGSFDSNMSPNGSGVLITPNGSRYEGQFSKGTYEGKGIYRNVNGRVLDGDWIDGKFSFGTATDPDGSTREVDMRMIAAKRSGKGRTINSDGDQYEGDFKDGTFHGIGHLKTSRNNEYTGEFANGSMTRGRLRLADGSVYEGTMVNGKYDGYGIRRGADNDFYEGEYKAGVRHGFGMHRWPSGATYEGYYEDGLESGKGRYVFAGGDKTYEGNFVKGNFHGYGVMVWDNGYRYEGQFVNGERQGNATKPGGIDGEKLFFAAMGSAIIGSASGVSAAEKVRVATGMVSDMYGVTKNGEGIRAATSDVTQARRLRAELARHQAEADDLARVTRAAAAQRAEMARQPATLAANAAPRSNAQGGPAASAAQARITPPTTPIAAALRETASAAAAGVAQLKQPAMQTAVAKQSGPDRNANPMANQEQGSKRNTELELGPVKPEMLAICRQGKGKGWACNGALDNQIIFDEPTVESALARQRCEGGTWAAGGPTIDGVKWEAYRCNKSLGDGDYDITEKYMITVARRSYQCEKNKPSDGRCTVVYGQAR